MYRTLHGYCTRDPYNVHRTLVLFADNILLYTMHNQGITYWCQYKVKSFFQACNEKNSDYNIDYYSTHQYMK